MITLKPENDSLHVVRGTIAVAALMISMALAGCAGDSADSNSIDGPSQTIDPSAPDLAVLQGVVVDNRLQRVIGATVSLPALEKETESNEDGEFAFADIVPGSYQLLVTSDLHHPNSIIVDLLAGNENPFVKVVVNRISEQDPYVAFQPYNGFIACTSGGDNIGGSEECGSGVGVPGVGRIGGNPDDRNQLDFYVDGTDIHTIIVEQSWEPGQVYEADGLRTIFGENWTCDPSCGGNGLTEGWGDGYIHMRVDKNILDGVGITPQSRFSVMSWAKSGSFGVVAEQPYDLMVSVFYHAPAPEGWAFANGDRDPWNQENQG